MRILKFIPILGILFLTLPWVNAASVTPAAGIPIRFTLKEPGFVTLVVENDEGVRVRNLVSETEFPAGDNVVYWDGLDDRERDLQAASRGIYSVPGKVVPLGDYTVRGLVRPKIGLTYEMSPYTNGNPAWFTSDRSSGWLSNHRPPSGILFVPAKQAPEREGKPASRGGQILVCSPISEGGSGLAWLDMDGNKIWGQEWIGGSWAAASHLAIDQGDKPIPGVYAYTGVTFGNGKEGPELRLNKWLIASEWGGHQDKGRYGTGEDRSVFSSPYAISSLPPPKNEQEKADLGNVKVLRGLAVRNGMIVVALARVDKLLFIDGNKGVVVGEVPMKDPSGLAYDRNGRLYVLSGKKLLRFEQGGEPATLGRKEVLIDRYLEDPQAITVDRNGSIYVSDWGRSHQVKMFSVNGIPLRAYGKQGTPSLGAYDPRHMNYPRGITIDDRGRLWVAEEDSVPKRVSVWAPNGELDNAFYGPAEYGGGGSFDPRSRDVFYYGGMQFRLDWKTGKSRVESVLYRRDLDLVPLWSNTSGGFPETSLPKGNSTYLTNAFNSNPTNGADMAEVWLVENGVARKVAAMGSAWRVGSGTTWREAFLQDEAIKALLPTTFDPRKEALFFAWSDKNGDGKMQAHEVVFQAVQTKSLQDSTRVNGVTVEKDLSFVVAQLGGNAVRFKVSGVTRDGVPLYDITKPEVLAENINHTASSGCGQAITDGKGWTVLTTAPGPYTAYSFGGVLNGKPMWSYADLWPGLHPSHNAAPQTFPGEVLGATRLVGLPLQPKGSDVGPMWAINSNKGMIYIFTMDGMFVATLFQDSRTASWNAPQAIRGMPVGQFSMREENFFPTITQMDDGEVYLQTGTNDGPIRIVRVTGLDGVRRLPESKVTLTSEVLNGAINAVRLAEAKRQEARLPKILNVLLLNGKLKVDGDFSDWKSTNWAEIDTRRVQLSDWGGKQVTTKIALAVADGRLYGAMQTDDPQLLKNAGTSFETLFKTGGGWDIMLGTDAGNPQRMSSVAGDIRLFISQVDNRPVAMLYRPVAPGYKAPPVKYISMVKTVVIDQVEEVSDSLELASAVEKDPQTRKPVSVDFEFSIPLARLGLTTPTNGQTFKGDVGVLRGDGFRTQQRVYWSNKSSGLVSDAPGEAELTPGLWGTFVFKNAGTTAAEAPQK
jgi:hypothetical protein